MKNLHVYETDVLGVIDLTNHGSGFAGTESISDFISDWQIANRKQDKKNLKSEKQEFKLEYPENFGKNYY